MLQNWSAAAIFCSYGDFRGDGGSTALKVPQNNFPSVERDFLWRENGLKRALSKNLSPVKWQRGSNRREGEKKVFWGGGRHQFDQRKF